MGNLFNINAKDFQWEYTDQPHASRRIKILKKHPEIRKLMTAKGDQKMARIGILICISHLILSYFTHKICSQKPFKFLSAISVGSWLAAWIFLSLHEAAHGLLFGPAHPRLNKLYGLLANLFLGVPVFSFFKKHHLDHHKFQGDHIMDVEYPTKIEVQIFNRNPVTKFLWVQLNGVLQHIRTVGGKKPKTFSYEELLNNVTVWGFDLMLVYLGHGYLAAYFAFCLGVALGGGLVGAWGIATHTMFFQSEDTLSYYGWLNPLYLNIGYHMEHHDFPNIPARLLPEIRNLAPEFYRDQHHLDSLFTPVFKFLHQDDVGLHSRLKRDTKSEKARKSHEG